MNNLKKYNQKRDFHNTKEPVGKKQVSHKKLRFVIQHHLARKDHYDLRLELNGVLKSWAIPKGPSYNPNDKRLAVMVEDHPYSYRTFEGVIPKGQYGGGTVMLFDEGYWEAQVNPTKGLKEGNLKFTLKGKRLYGNWTLVKFKEDNWLLIKEKDEYVNFKDISNYSTSIKTGRTMKEIENFCTLKKEKGTIENIPISNPNKIIFPKSKTTKKEIIKYYEKVAYKMMPYVYGRMLSTVRAPEGVNNEKFFKKHFQDNIGLGKIKINSKEDFYYINSKSGIIYEAQMNGYEFHIGGSTYPKLNHPNMMVFDLDPDENVSLKDLRQGVKDLKQILDELHLPSFLKTSGGKGYHVVVPVNSLKSWKTFRQVAKDVAKLMETKWPDKYLSNMSKKKRKNKIFIDWIRNTKGASSIAPYSIRLREQPTVSMPISWKELDKIKPNEIKIKDALERLKKKDPWEDFFKL